MNITENELHEKEAEIVKEYVEKSHEYLCGYTQMFCRMAASIKRMSLQEIYDGMSSAGGRETESRRILEEAVVRYERLISITKNALQKLTEINL